MSASKFGGKLLSEARNFNAPGSVQLGAQTGFPPFNSNETNQKTGEWWQLLQQTP